VGKLEDGERMPFSIVPDDNIVWETKTKDDKKRCCLALALATTAFFIPLFLLAVCPVMYNIFNATIVQEKGYKRLRKGTKR
jgi:hypothetical protein